MLDKIILRIQRANFKFVYVCNFGISTYTGLWWVFTDFRQFLCKFSLCLGHYFRATNTILGLNPTFGPEMQLYRLTAQGYFITFWNWSMQDYCCSCYNDLQHIKWTAATADTASDKTLNQLLIVYNMDQVNWAIRSCLNAVVGLWCQFLIKCFKKLQNNLSQNVKFFINFWQTPTAQLK